MNPSFRGFKLFTTWLLLGFLAACGSGGGGGDTPLLPPPVPAPTITVAPTAAAVVAGQAATFSVVATGTAPVYQWQRNGLDIAGATAATYTLNPATVADNNAQFRVQVSNSGGPVVSPAVGLTVVAANAAPAITAQPKAVSVGELSATQFTVAAAGTGPFTYQWRRNGTAIEGATAATYTPPRLNMRLAENGIPYSVAVSNAFGATNSVDAVLSVVRAAPQILVQPTDVTVKSGTFPTFTVEFSGSPPLTFQWMRNGVDIPTAVVTVTDPTSQFAYSVRTINFAADSGSTYSVRISNDLTPPAVSRAALLTITP